MNGHGRNSEVSDMPEAIVAGTYFLKSDLSFDRLVSMYEEIESTLPSTRMTSSKEDMANLTIDPDSVHDTDIDNNIIINREIELYLQNAFIEDDTNLDASLPFNGRRCVELQMTHKLYQDMLSEIHMNNPELGFFLIPLFSTIGKGLDACFGMIGNEYSYSLTIGQPLFELDYSNNNPIDVGEIPKEIQNAFLAHGYKLSENARVQEMTAVSKTKCIVDRGRVYKPERSSPSGSLMIFDKTKEYTLWGIDYIDELLKSPAWYFYMDNQLVNEIGYDVIFPWADAIVKRHDHGYFITQYLSKSPDVSHWKEKKAFYNENIRPIITQRLRKEYSKIDLSHQEIWDRSRYDDHPLASR